MTEHPLLWPPQLSGRYVLHSSDLSLFFAITFIMSASPGPVMLSTMSNGARFGFHKALLGILGASGGNAALILASATGLGLLIAQQPLVFSLLRGLGAGYLIFLGLRIIQKRSCSKEFNDASPTTDASIAMNAFFIALSNPKGLLYFGALLPQFIHYQQPLTIQFLRLSLVFLTIDILWMCAYAAAGDKIMTWLKHPPHQIKFNILSGLILIIAGFFILFSGK